MPQIQTSTTGSDFIFYSSTSQRPIVERPAGGKTHGQLSLNALNENKWNKTPITPRIHPEEPSGKRKSQDGEPLQMSAKGKEPVMHIKTSPPEETKEDNNEPTVGESDTLSELDSPSVSTSDDSSLEDHSFNNPTTQVPGAHTDNDTERKNQIEKLKAEITKRKEVKHDLEKEIEGKKQEVEVLKSEIINLQERDYQSESSTEMAELKRQRQHLRDQCKELISDKKELMNKLNKARSEIETLENRLEDLEAELRRTKRKSRQDVEDLREELDQTKSELDGAKEELAKIKLERDEHAGIAENLKLRETDGQAPPQDSTSLTTTSVPDSSQKVSSHTRSGSSSKHNPSSKREAKVAGSYPDIFGRGERKTYIEKNKRA